nr:CAP domain-containing protein [uncultured Methanospirillum sp.]
MLHGTRRLTGLHIVPVPDWKPMITMKSLHLISSFLLLLFLVGFSMAESPIINNSTILNSSAGAVHADLLNTADLAIIASITPREAEMGSPFSAAIGVVNPGPAAADQVRIDYYLVPNATGAIPIWIHQKTAEEIPAFYSDRVPFTVDLPGGITPGEYNLMATISTVTIDRNLSNNEYISAAPVEVKRAVEPSQSDLPDLDVSLDSISATEITPDYPLTINYTVSNIGKGSAGTFRLGFYLSKDPEVDPSDQKLWDVIFYQAYPGMSEPGSSTNLIPHDIAPGEYYLGAVIDFTHMVLEADEEGNTAVLGTPITITPQNPPVTQAFLDQVAGYITEKTNKYREYRDLSALNYDPKLAAIAQSHSTDMAARNYFAHETPEGVNPTGRAQEAKYETTKRLSDGSVRIGIAENIVKIAKGNIIGKGYSGFVDPSDSQQVADVMMIEWINSPEHNQNLVNTGIDRIGVGVTYDGEFFYATQNFY